MAFDANNVFTNHHAKHSVWAPIAVLFLWLLSRLFSGLFDGLRHRRARGAAVASGNLYNPYTATPYTTVPVTSSTSAGGAAVAAVAAGGVLGPRRGYADHAHQTTKALRDLFIWLFAAWVLNYVINGFYRKLTILIWVVAALGILWALLKKPLHKFADILLIPLIAGIVWLFLIPVTDTQFRA